MGDNIRHRPASDRIEKLYDRWARAGVDEDRVHEAIDRLLIEARILQYEDGTTVMIDDQIDNAACLDELRVSMLDTLADLAAIEPDYTGPWHVVRYDVTREFGGSEEGGWWYDWYTNPVLIATLENPQITLARWVAQGENERAKEERVKEGRPQGRHSVLGGVDHVYTVEKTVGESTSTETPRYE